MRELIEDQEWLACCFPRPDFADSCIEDRDDFSMQDLKEFYDDCMELKDMVWYTVIFPLYSICSHIIEWREPWLSTGMILYWWLVCLWPRLWLPSLPLHVAFWLRVMRCLEWRNVLMTHQALVPLSQEGLNAIATHNSSRKMYAWLTRLIKDRGGWVTKTDELRGFAKRMHKDGKPTLQFSELVKELEYKDKTWITWNTGQRKKKCRCNIHGYDLQLLGYGAYRSTGDMDAHGAQTTGWKCTGLPTKGRRDYRCCSGIDTLGEHLGIRRYRCRSCMEDYCALCAQGGKQTSMLLEQSKHLAALSSRNFVNLQKMLDVVTKYEEVVEDGKEYLLKLLGIIESCCSPSNSELARWVYVSCAAAAPALAMAEHFLRSSHSWLFWWPLSLLWAFAGSFLVLQRAAPLRRARTAWRATRDVHFIRMIRAKHSLNRWRFFAPEDPSRAETEIQEVMRLWTAARRAAVPS